MYYFFFIPPGRILRLPTWGKRVTAAESPVVVCWGLSCKWSLISRCSNIQWPGLVLIYFHWEITQQIGQDLSRSIWRDFAWVLLSCLLQYEVILPSWLQEEGKIVETGPLGESGPIDARLRNYYTVTENLESGWALWWGWRETIGDFMLWLPLISIDRVKRIAWL